MVKTLYQEDQRKVVDDPDKKKKKRPVWRVEGGDAERAEENEEVQRKKKIKK